MHAVHACSDVCVRVRVHIGLLQSWRPWPQLARGGQEAFPGLGLRTRSDVVVTLRTGTIFGVPDESEALATGISYQGPGQRD